MHSFFSFPLFFGRIITNSINSQSEYSRGVPCPHSISSGIFAVRSFTLVFAPLQAFSSFPLEVYVAWTAFDTKLLHYDAPQLHQVYFSTSLSSVIPFRKYIDTLLVENIFRLGCRCHLILDPYPISLLNPACL